MKLAQRASIAILKLSCVVSSVCVSAAEVTVPISAKRSCEQVAGVVAADSPMASDTSDSSALTLTNKAKRLRVVVTSDFPPIGVVKSGNVPNDQKSDPDDMQSMVRFLLYSNEFDIEGLMATSGTFAGKARKQNILDVIGRYGQVYENLRKHDPQYPTADRLRSVTFEGRDGTWGKKGQRTSAKERIVKRPTP